MAKLKYDRPINISMQQNQTVTIPKDEVWKVSTDTEGSSVPTKLFGGGDELPQHQFKYFWILWSIRSFRHRLQTHRGVAL